MTDLEGKKLLVINTMKHLRRPCTTLDLAKGMGMTRKEANPLLYAFQSEGLIRKVQESNPPLWDLTPEGDYYGTKKKESGVGRGRGRGLLSLPSSTYSPGAMATNVGGNCHLDSNTSLPSSSGKNCSIN